MRTNRPYVQIDPDVLERVRQIDLLSYLREFEPSNLVKVKGTSNVYCTAEHDSLKISNGKWYWWSRGFGGYSALDYLIKVKEYDFVEAVEILTGQTLADWKPPPAPKKDEPKVLLLPPQNKDCNRVIQYLFGRGIDYQLIQDCVADGTVFESAEYHNAVFVGKDKNGTPKYAALRSTVGSSFKGDASGSDKRYSFRLLAREPTDKVHLFEAAIDLLSYDTYLKCEGKDYRKENLLSLSGVYQPKKELSKSKIPIALSTYLQENPQIKTVILHLDNDRTGRLCTAVLKELLQKDYKIVDAPPPVGKDVKQNYGAPKITVELRKTGEVISERTVGTYMRQMGIRAQWSKPWTITTKDSDFSTELQNILDEQFNPDHPNAVWCSDITYIWTIDGFVYLTSVMDLFSRKIIAWTLSETLEVSCVIDTINKAKARRNIDQLLIIHSDRGSQYVAKEYKKATENMQRSYSKKAFPWDNACIESFHSIIKREWLNRFKIRDYKQAYQLIFEYLEAFYNTKRIHSHCNYMSPNEFEQVYERTNTEAELLAG